MRLVQGCTSKGRRRVFGDSRRRGQVAAEKVPSVNRAIAGEGAEVLIAAMTARWALSESRSHVCAASSAAEIVGERVLRGGRGRQHADAG